MLYEWLRHSGDTDFAVMEKTKGEMISHIPLFLFYW